MSNLGQVALTVVGAAIGYEFGYPQLGLVLGSLAGQALFPTQLPGITGPKISDLATTTAELGGPVPWVFGTIAVPGTVIYLGELITISTTTHQGKGGPQQSSTSFSYSQTLGVGLCKGTVGLMRIWENGELVYDIRPQQAGESDDAFTARAKAASKYAQGFVFYPGDEDQLADPTIELDKGVGQVPGFRGLAYIMFPDRPLRNDQGLRHPTFRFEVYTSGLVDCETVEELTTAVLYPWLNVDFPVNELNANEFTVLRTGGATVTPPQSIGPYDTLSGALNALADITGFEFNYVGYAMGAETSQRWLAQAAGPAVSEAVYSDAAKVFLHYNNIATQPVKQFIHDFDPFGVSVDRCALVLSDPAALFAVDTPNALNTGGNTIYKFAATLDHPPAGWDTVSACIGTTGAWSRTDCVITCERRPGGPPDPCHGVAQDPPGYVQMPDGTLIQCTDFVERTITGPTEDFFLYLQAPQIIIAPTDPENLQPDVYSHKPIGPVLEPTDPQNNATFWEAAYRAQVDKGVMPDGLTYLDDYPQSFAKAWFRSYQRCTAVTDSISLATIIEQVCAACGQFPVDASDLEDVTVRGYALANTMTGRDALTPLRSVGYWDCVESGRSLKFVARGKDIVATIGITDLGAADADGGDSSPAVATDRMQDVDLPRSIRVHYIAPSRDYGDGQQQSPHRITTRAVNDTDVELAVAMDDDQAAQVAEVIWADAWAGRESHTVNLDRSYAYLEGGDCITVPIDGREVRTRIVGIADASALLRKVSLLDDDNEAYVSTAVAQVPQRPPSTVRVAADTNLLLLDLPALADSDNDAGIYATADSAGNGTVWNGAIVFRSTDGSAWSQVTALGVQAPRGTVTFAVPPGITDAFDPGTTIAIELQNGELENRTADAVLAGANAAAIGRAGRWEIIQFTTADNVSGTSWILSGLLRGRRGTEYVMGSSQAGDYFVMLSTGALARIPLDIANIGQPLLYRAVSLGLAFESGIQQTFTGEGRALLPFAPVSLAATRDAMSGDITLTWIRRGRLGQELRSGVDIPLSEETESYAVDVLASGSPDTLLRTLSAATQSVLYTATNQTLDFGAPLNAGDAIRFVVSQLSAVVGRGTPAAATVIL